MRGFLAWQGRHLLRIVGWSGTAGIVLAIAVAVFHVCVFLPLQDSEAEMHAGVERLRNSRLAVRHKVNTNHDPAMQLVEFYQFFPEEETVTETIGSINQAALEQGLVLEHGEYQLATAQEGKLLRYDIVLPVKGPYLKQRHFIAKVLQDHSNLALDGISFTRQTSTDTGVNAQIRMALFLRVAK